MFGGFLAPGLERLRSFSCLYCNVEGLRQGLAGLPLFGSRQRALCAKQPQDTLPEKHPPPEPRWLPVCQTARRWPLLAAWLSSSRGSEEPRGPDLRISELATYSGRRMRGGRTRGRSKGIASSLRCRRKTLLCSVFFDVTGVSVAHAACRCHEARGGQPPVLTADVESDLSLFPFSELFIFPKGCMNDALHTHVSSHICSPILCVCVDTTHTHSTVQPVGFDFLPLGLAWNGLSWIRTTEPGCVANQQEVLRDCGFKLSAGHSCCSVKGQRDFLNEGALMAPC